MFINASAHKAATAAKAAAMFSGCALLIIFSNGSRLGASRGIELCLSVLLPSLFPFMALTTLFVKSGLCLTVGRRLNRITRLLFGVSGALAPVILLSLIGGYPVGAGGIASLREQGAITEKDAQRASLFAVCAGPGFVISYTGAALYSSTETGIIIFASQVASVLVTGFTARCCIRGKEDYNSENEIYPPSLPFGQALAESVCSAAKGALVICAFVTAFSSATGILEQAVSPVPDGVYILLEVCSAVNRLAHRAPITYAAFAIGFGGLCTHLQIFTALNGVKVQKGLFFLFRIMQGFLTEGFTYLGLKNLPQSAEVFSTSKAGGAAFFGGSVISGAVLLTVAVCFLISVNQRRG